MDAMARTIIDAILHVSRKSGTLPTTQPKPTADAIRAACAMWEQHARGLVTPDLKDAPAWAAYEMKILELGRALELVMRKMDLWRGKGDVLDAAADVVSCARYGRGRRSWVATLGEHGGGEYGEVLAGALTDEGIAGYAMKALLRGGNGSYVAQVLAASERGLPWVKNAARLYQDAFLVDSPRDDGRARAADRRPRAALHARREDDRRSE
jgi:hypothetical protein